MKYIEAASFGGPFPAPPCLLVVHAIESPIRAGFAASLAGPNYFGRPQSQGGPGTSVHWLTDPVEVVEGVHPSSVAWHVGPGANFRTLGQEHTGYTAMSRAEWTTPAGLAMLANGARHYAAVAAERGIPWRWLSLAQLATACRTRRMADGGLTTHNDIRIVCGGTTHTDPGPGFPYDLYLAYGRKGFTPAPVPTPAPAPDGEPPMLTIFTRGDTQVQYAAGPGVWQQVSADEARWLVDDKQGVDGGLIDEPHAVARADLYRRLAPAPEPADPTPAPTAGH